LVSQPPVPGLTTVPVMTYNVPYPTLVNMQAINSRRGSVDLPRVTFRLDNSRCDFGRRGVLKPIIGSAITRQAPVAASPIALPPVSKRTPPCHTLPICC